MPSSHDLTDSLADMIDNIERIAAYTAAMDRAAFAADGRTRDAVERCLERVCEAARRLEDRAIELMPDQPWREIRGMGNRLRHGYDRIETNVIWHTIRQDLPLLEADVRRVLERLTRDAASAEPP